MKLKTFIQLMELELKNFAIHKEDLELMYSVPFDMEESEWIKHFLKFLEE